jgi:hypothetical protein
MITEGGSKIATAVHAADDAEICHDASRREVVTVITASASAGNFQPDIRTG